MASSEPLFVCMSSAVQCAQILTAQERVYYVAPGIGLKVATAISKVVERLGSDRVRVSVDFDESVLRMGYGDPEAVELLSKANVKVLSSPGLRATLLVVDSMGWVFTPTALYLEAEPQSVETPNGLRLSSEQVEAAVLRISPIERNIALEEAVSPEERKAVEEVTQEIGSEEVTQEQIEVVSKKLKDVPRVKFNVARQVRVFEPYLLYVELELHGAAIQRRAVRIPKEFEVLGGGKELEGRLKTSFQFIERESQISSKKLEEMLKDIRDSFTPSIGKSQRVMLKAQRPLFDKRVDAFRAHLAEHQLRVKRQLQQKIDESKNAVIEYYLTKVMKNPPDKLLGRILSTVPSEEECRLWLRECLDPVFPSADKLATSMNVELRFKDVTFETLNDPEFCGTVKTAFPMIDWAKLYSDFQAMGEHTSDP